MDSEEIGEEAAIDDDSDFIDQAVQCEIQDRLWIRTIVQFLHSRRSEPDKNDEVQRHLDCAAIAAAMRLERIFSGDRPTMECD